MNYELLVRINAFGDKEIKRIKFIAEGIYLFIAEGIYLFIAEGIYLFIAKSSNVHHK